MSVTAVVITGCVLTLVIWDLIVVLKKGVGSTVSRTIQRAWYCSPVIVFGCGALFGHFVLFLDPGGSVIAIPEDADVVSCVRIEDIGVTAVFVPDTAEAKVTDKKTGEVVECQKKN